MPRCRTPTPEPPWAAASMLRGAAEAWPCSLLMLMLMLLLASWGPRWVGRGPRWVEVRTAGAKCARQGAAVGRSRSSCSRAQQQGAAAATLFSNCCIHSVSGGRSCDWEVSATAVPPSPPAPGSGQYPVSRCLQPASMVAPVGRMEFVMVVARLCVPCVYSHWTAQPLGQMGRCRNPVAKVLLP